MLQSALASAASPVAERDAERLARTRYGVAARACRPPLVFAEAGAGCGAARAAP